MQSAYSPFRSHLINFINPLLSTVCEFMKSTNWKRNHQKIGCTLIVQRLPKGTITKKRPRKDLLIELISEYKKLIDETQQQIKESKTFNEKMEEKIQRYEVSAAETRAELDKLKEAVDRLENSCETR